MACNCIGAADCLLYSLFKISNGAGGIADRTCVKKTNYLGKIPRGPFCKILLLCKVTDMLWPFTECIRLKLSAEYIVCVRSNVLVSSAFDVFPLFGNPSGDNSSVDSKTWERAFVRGNSFHFFSQSNLFAKWRSSTPLSKSRMKSRFWIR